MFLSLLAKIKTHRSTRVGVTLNYDGMIEAGFFDAQAKPARPGKKFD
jgi:hypothetical protein